MNIDRFDNSLRPLEGGGAASPKGFTAAGIHVGIASQAHPGGLAAHGAAAHDTSQPDLAILLAAEPVETVALFTKSTLPAAPIQINKVHLPQGSGRVRALVMNAGSANAATGEAGVQVAHDTCEITAQILGCETEQVLVASTGSLGVPLALDPIETRLPDVIDAASSDGGSAAARVLSRGLRPLECAISYPSGVLAWAEYTFTVGGMCARPGTGIADDTSLITCITLDAPVSHQALNTLAATCASPLFHHIALVSAPSTNGMIVMMASGAAAPEGPLIEVGTEEFEELAYVVQQVCGTLVRLTLTEETDSHIARIRIVGAASLEDAELAGRAVVSSTAVRAALSKRCSPLAGTISALGASGLDLVADRIGIDLLGVEICRDGMGVAVDEEDLARRFETPEIELTVDLGLGEASTTLWAQIRLS
ncbi:bifunctional ornithine acetyltransferase/N-acetylglutamate synthase [Collinsella sp. AGMB00827]|uniref:Arginine biosynthesis bifunctional protein ArgJ n=1 Tax=Collinsella ureilytica TaxID=2869515 RepID=A0ABS7MK24_9ACTN|nr:bifunctional ornithine acetyltransferase/N-acetylglutamate synthase [Collinsella urealyticum]MBY4797440.1 bifunctional ornithine acetyltransferase/N-acetylglutamate synthase [Collinsella urealyticum]